jgi:hypothetical protein
VDVDGIPFSDTFTGIAAPGYRFVGWQVSEKSLCAGQVTPCVLQDLPATLTALPAETYLLPLFELEGAPVSINSSSASGYYSQTYSPVPERPKVAGVNYSVFAVNDLGMHCVDLDGRIANILPPFQVMLGQIIQKGGAPVLNPAGVSLAYSAASNPLDPILDNVAAQNKGVAPDNTLYKSNFWDGIPHSSYDAFYPPVVTPLSTGPFPVIENVGLPVPNAELLYIGENGVVGDGDESLSAVQHAMPGVTQPMLANDPQPILEHYVNKPFFVGFPIG